MAREAATVAVVERSLRLLPLWWVLRWAWLGEAIWVIYLIQDRGLTLGQVLLFDAVVFGVTVLAEVPTGVVADRYSRRLSMVLGSLIAAGAFVAFGLAGTIPVLLGSYVLFAVGSALMSGADDAFLFDSLRAVGRADEFAAVAGRLNGTMTVAIAGFTVAGGVMVIWTPLSWPIVVSGLLSLLAAGCAWLLVEPPRQLSQTSFLRTGRNAGLRMLRTRALRWIVVIAAAVQATELLVFSTFQPILVGEGVPVWALGWIAASMMLVSALGSWSSGRFARTLGLDRSLRLLPAAAALAVLGGASQLLWLFPLYALAVFSHAALHPLVAEYLSRRVPDDERATVLSVNQLAAWIATIAITLGLGLAVDRSGLGVSLTVASAALLAVTVGGYLLWRSAGDPTARPAAPPGERGR